MQTKRYSLLESLANVFTGMIVTFIISQLAHTFTPEIQRYLWRGFEWKISAGSNVIMTLVLTVVSIIRSYMWRRHFNAKLNNLGVNNG